MATFQSLTAAQCDAKSPLDEDLINGDDGTSTGGVRYNLDALDERTTALEATGNVASFASLFDDCVIPGSHPSEGAGNSGLSDTASTNPHGKDFATVRYIHGCKYYYIHGIRPTGRTVDRSSEFTEITEALQEWQVFGNWTEDEMVVRVYTKHDSNIRQDVASQTGIELEMREDNSSFISINGVYDSIGLLSLNFTNRSSDIKVYVDGAAQTALSINSPNAAVGNQVEVDQILSHADLKGLGLDLHETVFIQSDSSQYFTIHGFVCVGDNVADGSVIGGNVLIDKVKTTIAETASVSAPTFSNTYGGLAVLYMDRTSDGDLTWAVTEVEDVTTTTASVISGGASTTVDVASGQGSNWDTGDIAWVQDGTTTQEFNRVSSVSTDTLTMANTFSNGFSSGVAIKRVGRTWLNSAVTKFDDTWEANGQRLINRFWYRCFGHENNDTNTFGILNGAVNDVHYTLRDYTTHLSLGGTGSIDSQQGNAGSNAYDTFDGFRSAAKNWGVFVFTGTGCAFWTYNSSSLTNGYDIYYQGVLIGSLDSTADDGIRRHNIISGLPMGTHVIGIYHDGTGTEDQYIMGADVFSCDLPPAIKPGDGSRTQYEGNILAYRHVLADYDFSLADSGGVVSGYGYEIGSYGVRYLPDVRRTWIFDNGDEDRTNDFDASISEHTQENFGANTATTDHTNASAELWFFGTGFEFVYITASSGGLADITINGSALTTGNFGGISGNIYESNGASATGFDSTTNGRLDSYAASATTNARLGVDGLSAAPEWHHFKITNTGSKNASSSGYGLQIVGFGVIGGEGGFTRAVAHGRFGNAGDVLDMRKLSPIPTLYDQYVYPVQRHTFTGGFSGTTSRFHAVNAQGLDLYSDGRWWEIKTRLVMTQASSEQPIMALYNVDGKLQFKDWGTTNRKGDAFEVDTNLKTFIKTELIYLDEGDHTIKLHVYPQTGGIVFTVEGETIMSADPKPKDWRPR